MKKVPRLKVLLGSLLLVAALLAVAVIPVAAQTFFSPFSGAVTINGVDAPTGTVVEAYIDGTPRALVTTTELGHYNLVITGGATDVGSAVSFKVGGVAATATPANPTFQLNAQAVDLAVGGVPPTYCWLTMAVSPVGGGTTSPAVGAHEYLAGTNVQLTAAPLGLGMQFDYWIINGTTVTANPTTVTMTSDMYATAYFTPLVPGDYPVLTWWLTTL